MSFAANINPPRQSFLQWISSHGFVIFLLVYGLWVFAPFLAPVLMHIGWTGAGKAIYFIYSFFCHQLPERSFFLFGEKTMYSLAEIQAAWQDTVNPMLLRQFIGNAGMGWKIAWSDRMISFYTSVWLFALLGFTLRRKIKPLVLWGFVLLLLPIIVDGGTHAMSDLAGLGNGFRDTNMWLAGLTNYSLPTTFYAGDALGSFNSTMRYRIETVFGQLVERFHAKRVWARDLWHLTSRWMRKVLSHTLAVYFCFLADISYLSFAKLVSA